MLGIPELGMGAFCHKCGHILAFPTANLEFILLRFPHLALISEVLLLFSLPLFFSYGFMP